MPFQVLLVSPPFAPVWIAGLVKLSATPISGKSDSYLGPGLLAAIFMATGGKSRWSAGLTSLVIRSTRAARRRRRPIIAINGDIAETIGWPEFVETIATVYRGPAGAGGQ